MRFLYILFLFIISISLVYAEELQFKTTTDNLEIGETLGNVIASFDSTHLSMLADNTLKTTKGDEKYKQYLRFKDANLAISSGSVVYEEDEDDRLGDFLKISDGTAVTDAIFEYELDFDEGAESDIDKDSNTLRGFNNAKLNFMNKEYVIVSTNINTDSNKISLNLLGSATVTTMYEGDEKNFTINDKTFIVKMNSINPSPRAISIQIDGQTTNQVKQGETITVNGIVMGVTKIVIDSSNKTDMADIFIGTDHILLRDADYTDNSYYQGVEIAGKSIPKAYVKIKGEELSSATEFKLDSISYRLLPYSNKGSDIYLSTNEKLSSYLKEANALLGSWDIEYRGLESTQTQILDFDPNGDSSYEFEFLNSKDKLYKFPFVSNTASFKLGTQSSPLFFIEPSANTDFAIANGNYFILTSSNSKTGTSSILRYSSIDTASKKIAFEDLSGTELTSTYSATTVSGATGEGEIAVEGTNYKFYIANSTGNNISIDLTNDGSINSGEANLIIKGGGIIDLGSTNTPSDDFTITLTTDGTQFEESSSDETISIVIDKRDGNKVGISSVSGVTMSKGSGDETGLTDYGVRVTLSDPGSTGAESLSIAYPISQMFALAYLISTSEQKANVSILEIATCTDNEQNQGELGEDCGGPCEPCELLIGTCEDGIKNQDEENIDCGGTICEACVEEIQCQGCLVNEQCHPTGARIDNSSYCSQTFNIANLKANKEPCLENYECLSNICINNSCKPSEKEGPSAFIIILINLAVLVVILVGVSSISRLSQQPPQQPPQNQGPQQPPQPL
jgi:hypothetical protein